jgi:hypothetical protein
VLDGQLNLPRQWLRLKGERAVGGEVPVFLDAPEVDHIPGISRVFVILIEDAGLERHC